MSWTLPASDVRVEYELWMTPKEPLSAPLKKSFREVAVALGEYAQFTPHFALYNGTSPDWNCINEEGENDNCGTDCTIDGLYCSISGAMVVTESLRQICIWRLYGSDDLGRPWWDYIEEFEIRCAAKFFDSEPCVKDAMQQSGVDYDKVSSCMTAAGGLGEGVRNTILDEELFKRRKERAWLTQSLFVNQTMVLRGAMTTSEIFEAICADYIVGSEPPICKRCNECSDVNKCVEVGSCPGSGSPNTASLPVFAGSLLGLVTCFLGLLQWRRPQRQTRAPLRCGIETKYMSLDTNPSVLHVGFNEDDTHEREQGFELS